MTVALAATWNPRGEWSRLLRLLPAIGALYQGLAIAMPPHAGAGVVTQIRDLGEPLYPFLTPVWAWGRHLALQRATELGTDHIHYADMDRLLRWIETRPDEWRQTVQALQTAGFLVIGRTPGAYATHPQALVQTEAVSNAVVSYFLGRPMDVSAGSKGFSRAAAEWILTHSRPDTPFGVDAAWPILAYRGGFQVRYVEVDGLDWESADRFQDQAAGVDTQRQAAQAYDADPKNWAMRAGVANEIVAAALAVMSQ